MHMGWGNVVMVRHSYREPAEGNAIKTVDSLYGHLDTMLVRLGQNVARGQQIATIGTAYGLYEAHVHFEIRKNIHIGMFRSLYARDFSNYYDPTAFISGHRQLNGRGEALIALNSFTPGAGAQPLGPADGAYEMGINSQSPTKIAEMESAHLNKSAYSIKRRDGTTPAFDKINEAYKADRYSDLRHKDPLRNFLQPEQVSLGIALVADPVGDDRQPLPQSGGKFVRNLGRRGREHIERALDAANISVRPAVQQRRVPPCQLPARSWSWTTTWKSCVSCATRSAP